MVVVEEEQEWSQTSGYQLLKMPGFNILYSVKYHRIGLSYGGNIPRIPSKTKADMKQLVDGHAQNLLESGKFNETSCGIGNCCEHIFYGHKRKNLDLNDAKNENTLGKRKKKESSRKDKSPTAEPPAKRHNIDDNSVMKIVRLMRKKQ